MSSMNRELVFLILQFLNEEKFKETVHKLEQESAFYFNMKYFEEKVQAGEWEEIEKYLSGFTNVEDNKYSLKIYFEIRKQKFLEALDGQDKGKAADILTNELKVFSVYPEDLVKEMIQLLPLANFRENEKLSKYGDTKTARSVMLIELKKVIKANPVFHDKLAFPTFNSLRLRKLINQSLNWQHSFCKKPIPHPEIKTLLTDHTCNTQNGTLGPVNPPTTAVAKPMTYTPIGEHGPSQTTAANPNSGALAGGGSDAAGSSSVQAADATSLSLTLLSNQVSILKRSISATLRAVQYHNVDHEPLMKRLCPAQSVHEVIYPTVCQQASWSLDDLPRTVAFTLHQGSSVTTLDFHPSNHTLLLVGCNNGEIALWETGLRTKLNSKPFKIWNIQACTSIFKEVPFSVTRVTWSLDGTYFGVAFSKHLIHLYVCVDLNDLCQHMEIDAHCGGVNDIVFANPNKQHCVITCGDDKLVKVWGLTGEMLFNFEGHEMPVFSVCTHQKENLPHIFSTAFDGRIKIWLYDNMGPRVDYCAPGRCCTTLLFSANGKRLFSCGTGKDGISYLFEWNESEGGIKRTYSGFRNKSGGGVVQIDTTQNHFLAVGEDSQIKFWDMDNVNLLASTDAEGGLPNFPRLRFNKVGNLLAVTTASNGIKILVYASGMHSLRIVEGPSLEALRSHVGAVAMEVVGSSVANAALGSFAANCNLGSYAAIVAPVNPIIIEGISIVGLSTADVDGSSAANAVGSYVANAALGSSVANCNLGSSAAIVAHVNPIIIEGSSIVGPSTTDVIGSSTANAAGSSVANAALGSYAANCNLGSSAAIFAHVNPIIIEGSSVDGPSTTDKGIESIARSMEMPKVLDDANDKVNEWHLTEIVDPSQCRMVTMPDSDDVSNKVSRLLYTNSGIGVLALGSNGVQKLWKWPCNVANPSGKANTRVTPLIWHPNNVITMRNDTYGVNLAEAVPCIALSKDGTCVMSAIGGNVSLFNMRTFMNCCWNGRFNHPYL